MTRRVGRRVRERKRSKETDRGVEKGKNISPSNVRSRIRGSGKVEENMITELNVAIRQSRESMPKEPPSAGGIKKGYIIGVFAEEMTAIAAVSRTSTGSRVMKGLKKKVNLDKVPVGAKCVGRLVGNTKEAIKG